MSDKSIRTIDKIPYNAPLSFTLPSREWCNARGGFRNNRTQTLTLDDVPRVDMIGKWVLITGASSGIGREAAVTMARWGANLILACREPQHREEHPSKVVEKCQTAAQTEGHSSVIEWWRYNAADLVSVEALGQRWLETGRTLDVLCNNAGMGGTPSGEKRHLTDDGFEIVHQVNFLSHVLLTLMLLPSMAPSGSPRIVCTTSCFHYLGIYDLANFNGEGEFGSQRTVSYYKNNKLYFQIWLTELQHRLQLHDQYKDIVVSGVHPGYVASGIWYVPRVNYFAWLIELLLTLLVNLFGISSYQGSFAIVHAATSSRFDAKHDNPKDQMKPARYFNRVWEEDPMPHCQDRDVRLRLWRRVNDDLKLEQKGLLDVIGLYSES